jgi:hypothetical protein
LLIKRTQEMQSSTVQRLQPRALPPTVALLHAEPDFLADLAAAKTELAAARAKHLPLQRDCKFEATALAETPPQSP